jgi:hypothetical protein
MSMLLDLPEDVEIRIHETAREAGLTVADYVARLVEEAATRNTQLAEFHENIRQRLEALASGEVVDGEQAMARLISELG